MELILVRHTTPVIDKGVCYGQSDVGVGETFEIEVQEILNQVGQYDVVYSSPLNRCRLLAERIGMEVILDERLKEISFGDWEMTLWEDIPQEEIQPWYDDYVNYPAKNGESFMELCNRVEEFLIHIKKKSKNDKVVVVTHAGVIRAIHGVLLKIPLEETFNIQLRFGEILLFRIK